MGMGRRLGGEGEWDGHWEGDGDGSEIETERKMVIGRYFRWRDLGEGDMEGDVEECTLYNVHTLCPVQHNVRKVHGDCTFLLEPWGDAP
jgi:hypothetical protein